MAQEWKTVRMSAELASQIDAVRGQTPLARWVAEACQERLADEPSGPVLSVAEMADVQRAVNAGLQRRAEVRERVPPRFGPDADALARQAKLNAGKGM